MKVLLKWQMYNVIYLNNTVVLQKIFIIELMFMDVCTPHMLFFCLYFFYIFFIEYDLQVKKIKKRLLQLYISFKTPLLILVYEKLSIILYQKYLEFFLIFEMVF